MLLFQFTHVYPNRCALNRHEYFASEQIGEFIISIYPKAVEIRSKVTLIQSRSSDFSSLELTFGKKRTLKNNIASTANGGHYLYFSSLFLLKITFRFLDCLIFYAFPFRYISRFHLIVFVSIFSYIFSVVFMHFFPTYSSFKCIQFFESIREYLIKLCISEAVSRDCSVVAFRNAGLTGRAVRDTQCN